MFGPVAIPEAPAPTVIGYVVADTENPAEEGEGTLVRKPPAPPPPPLDYPPLPPPATTRYSTEFEPAALPAFDTIKLPSPVNE